MKYVFVFFIPGASGNFFSRCLNLLDNAVCFKELDAPTYVCSTQEKLDLLGYQQISVNQSSQNWVDWEHSIEHYNHKSVPPETQYVIWYRHPEYALLDQNLAGPDDQQYIFYIDASDNFEWVVLNAFYKNSFLQRHWLETGEQMRQDPKIHKISSKAIVNGVDSFFVEFERVCNIIGHHLTKKEKDAIIVLYSQWSSTILDYKNFDNFKKQIGFHF